MKHYITIAASLLLVFTGCKNSSTETALFIQRDSLLAAASERENEMNELVSAFNEVERGLDTVSAKQRIILLQSSKTGDLKFDQKKRINAEIAAINGLMDQNRKKIQDLYSKLNQSQNRNKQLEETVRLLNNQLNSKFNELAGLNEQLKRAYAQVDFLEMTVEILAIQNVEQAQELQASSTEMRTAYYIVEEMKTLKKLNVVDKEGGFLGMGKTSKLNNDQNALLFTKIDYLEVTSIPVNSKGIKIISTHPEDSYTLDKTGKLVNSIMINDPKQFWSVSKYLVVSK